MLVTLSRQLAKLAETGLLDFTTVAKIVSIRNCKCDVFVRGFHIIGALKEFYDDCYSIVATIRIASVHLDMPYMMSCYVLYEHLDKPYMVP